MRDRRRDAQHSIAVPLGELPMAVRSPHLPPTPGDRVRSTPAGPTATLCRDARGPSGRLGRLTGRATHPRPGTPVGPMDGTPLTPEQAEFLTFHLLAADDLPAHCVLAWVIHGELDFEALEAAVGEVHRRHDELCSAYLYDPEPVARPADPPAPAVEVLSSVPDIGGALTTIRDAAEDPMSLCEGEVWRVSLVHVTDERWVIGCAVHCVAFGARTESVLAEELADAYNAHSAALLPS